MIIFGIQSTSLDDVLCNCIKNSMSEWACENYESIFKNAKEVSTLIHEDETYARVEINLVCIPYEVVNLLKQLHMEVNSDWYDYLDSYQDDFDWKNEKSLIFVISSNKCISCYVGVPNTILTNINKEHEYVCENCGCKYIYPADVMPDIKYGIADGKVLYYCKHHHPLLRTVMVGEKY